MLFVLLSVAAAALHKPSPYVADDLGGIDALCVENNCGTQLATCMDGRGEGGKVCETRIKCIFNDVSDAAQLSAAAPCFEKEKWSDLNNDELQIFDCAKDQRCMADPSGASSFLQEEMKSRNLTTHGEKMSMIQLQADMEDKMHGHMIDAAHGMMLMKAHMMYMSAAEKAVKETTSLIQEVMQDHDLDETDKLDSLHQLAAHLTDIQNGVQAQAMRVKDLAAGNFPAAMNAGVLKADDAATTLEELSAPSNSTDEPVMKPLQLAESGVAAKAHALAVDALGNLRKTSTVAAGF